MKRIICITVLLLGCTIILFAENNNLSVEEIFDSASRIEGFQEVENVKDYYNFPNGLGKAVMIIHPNANPREEVLGLLAQLPAESMVYDYTDERGHFDRLFLDEANNNLLYVHIGINGNDSVLIFFKGGKRKEIDKFINKIAAEQPE